MTVGFTVYSQVLGLITRGIHVRLTDFVNFSTPFSITHSSRWSLITHPLSHDDMITHSLPRIHFQLYFMSNQIHIKKYSHLLTIEHQIQSDRKLLSLNHGTLFQNVHNIRGYTQVARKCLLKWANISAAK